MAAYTLYLVTDSTPAILGDKDICDVVEAALRGGVTIVQYRDKTSDTGLLIATARRLHAVTQKYGVPLLINDRVDVALAVGCEGVHLGQDDMGQFNIHQHCCEDFFFFWLTLRECRHNHGQGPVGKGQDHRHLGQHGR
jgi:thiamine-phosphate diphosphorylase